MTTPSANSPQLPGPGGQLSVHDAAQRRDPAPYAPSPDREHKPFSRNAKTWLVGISTMAALGLALPIGIGVTFAATDESVQGFGNLMRTTINDKRTLTSNLDSNIREVHVVNTKGSIAVRPPAPGESLRLVGEYGQDPDAPVEPALTVNDGVLRLDGACSDGNKHWLAGCGGEWTLVVPVDADVLIRSDGGEVTVSGMAGEVDVRNGVGLTIVNDYSGNNVSVEMNIGEVQLDCLSEPVAVEASINMGEVAITTPDTLRAAVIRTEVDLGDASVRPTHDPASASSLTATVDIGSIVID